MNATPVEAPINASFFDDTNTEGYIIWKKGVPLKKASEVRLMEGILFRKGKSTGFWKSRFYVLFEDRLAYFKVIFSFSLVTAIEWKRYD